MAEDKQVGSREQGVHAFLATRSRTGLVDDRDLNLLHCDSCHLGQPHTKVGSVVVAVDAAQPTCTRFEQIQSGDVDPVTGVHHEVRPIDGAQHSIRQSRRAGWHMCVRQQKERRGHVSIFRPNPRRCKHLQRSRMR